jgi:hypothetical protein
MTLRFLDAIILFIFSFFFTQGFEFVPASTFSVTYFPFYFALMIFYFLISLREYNHKQTKLTIKLKYATWIIIALLTVGISTYQAIKLRHDLGPGNYPVHDNPIQLELAVDYLKQGKNPYTENYLGTEHDDWIICEGCAIRNTLHHLITLPFYVLSSYAASYPTEAVIGYFDERMLHIVTLLISLAIIAKLVKNPNLKIILLSIFLYNPVFIHYFIEGRNDIFVFSFILWAVYLLKQKRYEYASLVYALAFASKQSSWLLLPFFFLYVFYKVKPKDLTAKILATIRLTWPFFLTTALLFVPFLLSDAKSFIDDIYGFPAGSIPTSYPISGMGVSAWLVMHGFIADGTKYFPFIYLQALVGLPVFAYLGWQLKKRTTLTNLLLSATIFLFTFWLFSRFFMHNYVGFLSMLLIAAMAFAYTEKNESS